VFSDSRDADDSVVNSIFGVAFAEDGRVATASYDGYVRLYSPGPDFKLLAPTQKVDGHPGDIAFSPDGEMLAVGNDETPTVGLFDGHSLRSLPAPHVDGLTGFGMSAIAWSGDGQILFAGGRYNRDGSFPVFAWLNSGRGDRQEISISAQIISNRPRLWSDPAANSRATSGPKPS